MYVVQLATMQPLTYDQAQNIENTMEVETDDGVVIGSGFVLGFSEAGLEGTRYAMLDTGDMPLVDARYYKLELSPVSENDGKYSATWVTVPCDRPIDDMAADKLDDMRIECSQYIEMGFYSSALGSPHRYSSDRDSQMNMQWNALAALTGQTVNHICYDSENVRAEREHTALQITQVCTDFGNHLWPKLRLFSERRGQIEAARIAGDKAELIAISWI